MASATRTLKTLSAPILRRAALESFVNADSQQIYRGLDVGTAKPTAAERAAVPHHLLDVADQRHHDAKRPRDSARRAE